MVKAIYRGHLATITECMGNPSETPPDAVDRIKAIATEHGLDEVWLRAMETAWNMDGAVLDHEYWVSFMDPDLIVDPTDDQVASAR